MFFFCFVNEEFSLYSKFFVTHLSVDIWLFIQKKSGIAVRVNFPNHFVMSVNLKKYWNSRLMQKSQWKYWVESKALADKSLPHKIEAVLQAVVKGTPKFGVPNLFKEIHRMGPYRLDQWLITCLRTNPGKINGFETFKLKVLMQ